MIGAVGLRPDVIAGIKLLVIDHQLAVKHSVPITLASLGCCARLLSGNSAFVRPAKGRTHRGYTLNRRNPFRVYTLGLSNASYTKKRVVTWHPNTTFYIVRGPKARRKMEVRRTLPAQLAGSGLSTRQINPGVSTT